MNEDICTSIQYSIHIHDDEQQYYHLRKETHRA